MSRHNRKHKLKWKDYFYRTLLSIAAIIILAYFMPRETLRTYDYHLGEPWDKSSLIAQDSFPVLKPEEQLQREKDSLKRYYEPYFGINTQIADLQEEMFNNDFQQRLKSEIPAYFQNHIIEKLHYVYEQGIMEAEDYDRLKEDGTQVIWIYEQNESRARQTKDLFTLKSAYEYVINEEDSTRFPHEKIMACNLSRFIQSNLTYDVQKSLQQQQETDNLLVPYIGQVQVGQKIIDRGEIVNEYTYNVLVSMEKYQQARTKSPKEKYAVLAGNALYATIMVVLLLFFFRQFRSNYLQEPRIVMLVLFMFMFFPIVTYTMVKHSFLQVHIIPYCVIPIFLRIFLDSRTAFITHTITILTCAMALSHPFEFVLTQSVAGLMAIYSMRQLTQRSELFRSAVYVIIGTTATCLCIDLYQGNFHITGGVDEWRYIYLCIAGALSLISYLLLIPIERIFRFTSTVTLVELSNINHPILRKLSENAPGTFQHSLQVANLAAEVANRIGGKSQLVRTGALYHDIGKIQNPVFFTENQNGTNPHEGLSYEQSAQIIIQHVRDGLKLADKYKLPNVIREFIQTHHGNSMARYFYVSYKNKYPEREIDPAIFTYPGPNPSTLEQAILMMVDAVEAASRSLSEYTEESVNALVDKIIDFQVQEGYFNRCPITFQNIADAKDVLKEKLKTIYHTRIQYPEDMNKK